MKGYSEVSMRRTLGESSSGLEMIFSSIGVTSGTARQRRTAFRSPVNWSRDLPYQPVSIYSNYLASTLLFIRFAATSRCRIL